MRHRIGNRSKETVSALGTRGVLLRLAELMFVEIARRQLEATPGGQAGWLAGLRDPMVARALAALHGEPAQRWTLDALAAQTGTSRSVSALSVSRRCNT